MTTSHTAGTAGDGWRVTDAEHAWQPDEPDHDERPRCRQCRRERTEGDHTRGQR